MNLIVTERTGTLALTASEQTLASTEFCNPIDPMVEWVGEWVTRSPAAEDHRPRWVTARWPLARSSFVTVIMMVARRAWAKGHHLSDSEPSSARTVTVAREDIITDRLRPGSE